MLDVRLGSIDYVASKREAGRLFLSVDVTYLVENVGRVAAYKWRVTPRLEVDLEGRSNDYTMTSTEFPVGALPSSVRVGDDTMLPGDRREDAWRLGMWLRAQPHEVGLGVELNRLLDGLKISYTVATEVSLSEPTEAVAASSLTAPDALVVLIYQALNQGQPITL